MAVTAALVSAGEAEKRGEMALEKGFGARHASTDDGDVELEHGPCLRRGGEPSEVGGGEEGEDLCEADDGDHSNTKELLGSVEGP